MILFNFENIKTEKFLNKTIYPLYQGLNNFLHGMQILKVIKSLKMQTLKVYNVEVFIFFITVFKHTCYK